MSLPGAGRAGPLGRLTVLEFAGLGGAPFAGMLLADLGASVIRIERPPAADRADAADVLNRGKRSLCVDLKAPGATALVLRLVSHADALIEGFRPGVMERLGLGPEVCLGACPRLVYGRLTGWGQDGPLSQAAGHDINFIAMTGALASIGAADSGPVPPLSLVADYAGGGMLLAFGMVSALLEAQHSGRGQVVDAAMLDGAAVLMASVYARHAAGRWSPQRGRNFMDGAAHYYTTYRCADGKWLAVGAIEPQFYALLLKLCGADAPELREQGGPDQWPAQRRRLGAIFAARRRDEWCALLEGTDACVAPVLEVGEAASHPHNAARDVFRSVNGVVQPAPAPRFSGTPAGATQPAPARGAHGDEVMTLLGLSAEERRAAVEAGVVHLPR